MNAFEAFEVGLIFGDFGVGARSSDQGQLSAERELAKGLEALFEGRHRQFEREGLEEDFTLIFVLHPIPSNFRDLW